MKIKATVIADSINEFGTRLITYELDYPRFIHAEIMTHRLFSRNAQSSRAVPVNKTNTVNKDFVRPIVWGENKSGMSSTSVLEGIKLSLAKEAWDMAGNFAFGCAELLGKIGLHKQWANRITEPFSTIKVVLSSTEWDNFFWLREDPDAAQPEIVELARVMKKAKDESIPERLGVEDWHTPYVKHDRSTGTLRYLDSNGNELYWADAIKISASCCAQVSYRNLDDTKQKALDIYARLFDGAKPHLSPVEHQAQPMLTQNLKYNYVGDWEPGITHVNRDGTAFSGNFRGFIQQRQLMETNFPSAI